LPLFLALSTSSPFWQSRRTGLKGYRLAAYDELPRTGVPELFRTKEEFDAYVAALVKAGVMEDSSYVWWAIRPSLNHPTLELRAPDCCTLLDDTLAIAALYRTLSRHLYNNPWRNADMNAVARAIVVENKWRAQRYGVHGTFVAEVGAETVAEMLDRVIGEIAADIDALACRTEIRRCQAIAAAGTSADAQLAIYEAHRKDSNRDCALRAVTDWIANATLQ
jgi:carboxylate-amine ligase